MIELRSPRRERVHRFVRFRENDDDELLLLCNFIKTAITDTRTMIRSISREAFIATEI